MLGKNKIAARGKEVHAFEHVHRLEYISKMTKFVYVILPS